MLSRAVVRVPRLRRIEIRPVRIACDAVLKLGMWARLCDGTLSCLELCSHRVGALMLTKLQQKPCTRVRKRLTAMSVVCAAVVGTANVAVADENGVSFWVPGLFGSLAATPQQPGWSLTSIYYHTDVSGGGNIAVSKEITI